jgi:hypothetical protein
VLLCYPPAPPAILLYILIEIHAYVLHSVATFTLSGVTLSHTSIPPCFNLHAIFLQSCFLSFQASPILCGYIQYKCLCRMGELVVFQQAFYNPHQEPHRDFCLVGQSRRFKQHPKGIVGMPFSALHHCLSLPFSSVFQLKCHFETILFSPLSPVFALTCNLQEM